MPCHAASREALGSFAAEADAAHRTEIGWIIRVARSAAVADSPQSYPKINSGNRENFKEILMIF